MAHSNHYFSVEALHVRMRNIHYASDASYLQAQCDKWRIPFHLVETGFEPDRNEKRTPCFLCSWNRRKVLFTEAQRLQDGMFGGTPHLDGQYTVFGEIVEGFDVLDKICAVETGQADRPVDDVRIIRARVVRR